MEDNGSASSPSDIDAAHLGQESGQDVSDVARMFDGRSVFITGASGFIGRVLMEKLLRCYSGIRRVYILMRAKKGESPEKRLHQVLDVPLFDRVRSMESPKNLLDKIVVIPGDIGESQLGISEENMQMMMGDETLSIVFHVAATVRFDEPLKKSVIYNLTATRTVIEFCRKLKNLVSFCHVSTAYANSQFSGDVKIEEKLYPINLTPQQVICVAEQLDVDSMQQLKLHLIGGRPNTYTYTKALAEHLIATEAIDLPVAIVRPGCVSASWKEPMPGWVDNINGSTGILVAFMKGLLRTMLITPDCKVDLIPVDITVNMLIAATYYVAKINNRFCNPNNDAEIEADANNITERTIKKCSLIKTRGGLCPEKHPPIFHANSGDLNPLCWAEMRGNTCPPIYKYPTVDAYRYPGGEFKSNKYHDLLMRLLVHYLPALISDGILTIMGKKRCMLWVYRRLHSSIKALDYFMNHNYNFQTKNRKLLQDTLNDYDRKELFMDIENLDWQDYFEDYVLGIR